MRRLHTTAVAVGLVVALIGEGATASATIADVSTAGAAMPTAGAAVARHRPARCS